VDHKLQAVVRLDVTSTGAVIEITGCLTDGGAGSLGALIRRTEALSGGMPVIVDLTRAGHIDSTALELLHQYDDPALAVLAPPELPRCALALGHAGGVATAGMTHTAA
jgi:hypothetical protein